MKYTDMTHKSIYHEEGLWKLHYKNQLADEMPMLISLWILLLIPACRLWRD